MRRTHAYRWVTVVVMLTLALAFGLATGCISSNPVNPNLVPGDSLHYDSTRGRG